jgi:hypothetical protein
VAVLQMVVLTAVMMSGERVLEREVREDPLSA